MRSATVLLSKMREITQRHFAKHVSKIINLSIIISKDVIRRNVIR